MRGRWQDDGRRTLPRQAKAFSAADNDEKTNFGQGIFAKGLLTYGGSTGVMVTDAIYFIRDRLVANDRLRQQSALTSQSRSRVVSSGLITAPAVTEAVLYRRPTCARCLSLVVAPVQIQLL